jgi:hypothetical protein
VPPSNCLELFLGHGQQRHVVAHLRLGARHRADPDAGIDVRADMIWPLISESIEGPKP